MSLFLPGPLSASRRAALVTVHPSGGSDPQRLVDGKLAPIYSSPTGTMGNPSRIQITLSREEELDFWAIHDLRIESSTLAQVRVWWSGGGSYIFIPTLEQQRSVVRGMWGTFPSATLPALATVEVELTFASITRFHLGEVSLGKALRLPYDYRAAARTDEPLVVVNGDARIMAGRARQSVTLDYPPSLSDDLAAIVDACGGPLHSVVVVPAEDLPDVIHGHLAPGVQRAEDLRIHTPTGIVITESMRSLR